MRDYRFYGKTELGNSTIGLQILNDRDRLQKKRFEIGSQVKEELDNLADSIKAFLAGSRTTQSLNPIVYTLKRIM